ncbi:MAG: DEAD/DEAH box helicase [Candidatus Nanoarchaeia archaeon]
MQFLKDKLQLRLYQQTILNTATSKNTLVVLPTGLGKTHIAIALAALRLPQGKILVLAPTKPLISQHLQTFSEYFSPADELSVFSGEVEPEKRKELWQKSQIIFSTPQTIRNDLLAGQINLQDVSLIVFDEAHRAVGDYAYVFLAKTYLQQANSPRILGLTASPGGNVDDINDICKNLFIEEIEARDRESTEVKPYVKKILIDYKFVELPEEFKAIKSHLDVALKSRLEDLKSLGFISTADLSKTNKKALIALQHELQGKFTQHGFEVARAMSICAALLKLFHAHALLESESLTALKNYFDELWRLSSTTKVRAVKDLVSDFHVRGAYSLAMSALEKGLEHPKIEALQKVISKQISENPNSRILVFTEFRTNISQILNALNELPCVKVHKFIGQASKTDKGMNQQTQIDIIKRFRSGEFNCLVCTAVAEEGLDIPQVDLVIFYSPVPSAIRNIQRRGRTGRQAIGKLTVLMTKGTKDERYYWIAVNKEKKMNLAIKSMSESSEKSNLENFFIKAEKPKPEESVLIFADAREHGPVIDYLFSQGINVKTGQLKAGDFILSEDIGVERKIVEDFVASLIDKRLFEQAQKMRENFTQPIYVVEGHFEDIFKARQVSSQAIWAALLSLIVDWKFPVLFSASPKETAELLAIIAKREQLERKKQISVRTEIKPKSFADQQQFFIEGLPGIGPSTAKALLSHFKTPAKIVSAEIKELQKVEGVGEKKAELIRKILDSEFKVDV